MSVSRLATFADDGTQADVTVEKFNEVVDALNSGGGGGGGASFPMNANIWYDNSTVINGFYDSGTVTLEPDAVQAALIRIDDADANLTAVGVYQATEPASESTVRLALYAPSETGTGRGFPGTKLADIGTVAVYDEGFDIYSVACDVAVSPGYYWIVASADVSFDVWSFDAQSGNVLGVDDSGAWFGGVTGASSGAQTAMPSSLDGVFDLDSREESALYVFFKVTPN